MLQRTWLPKMLHLKRAIKEANRAEGLPSELVTDDGSDCAARLETTGTRCEVSSR